VALSLSKGERLWSFEDKNFLSCSTYNAAGQILAFDSKGKVYSLSTANGDIERLFLTPHDFAKSPLVMSGYIYGSSSDGFVRAYPIP
jgi:outer membrane protein assembly factor BamB